MILKLCKEKTVQMRYKKGTSGVQIFVGYKLFKWGTVGNPGNQIILKQTRKLPNRITQIKFHFIRAEFHFMEYFLYYYDIVTVNTHTEQQIDIIGWPIKSEGYSIS